MDKSLDTTILKDRVFLTKVSDQWERFFYPSGSSYWLVSLAALCNLRRHISAKRFRADCQAFYEVPQEDYQVAIRCRVAGALDR